MPFYCIFPVMLALIANQLSRLGSRSLSNILLKSWAYFKSKHYFSCITFCTWVDVLSWCPPFNVIETPQSQSILHHVKYNVVFTWQHTPINIYMYLVNQHGHIFSPHRNQRNTHFQSFRKNKRHHGISRIFKGSFGTLVIFRHSICYAIT